MPTVTPTPAPPAGATASDAPPNDAPADPAPADDAPADPAPATDGSAGSEPATDGSAGSEPAEETAPTPAPTAAPAASETTAESAPDESPESARAEAAVVGNSEAAAEPGPAVAAPNDTAPAATPEAPADAQAPATTPEAPADAQAPATTPQAPATTPQALADAQASADAAPPASEPAESEPAESEPAAAAPVAHPDDMSSGPAKQQPGAGHGPRPAGQRPRAGGPGGRPGGHGGRPGGPGHRPSPVPAQHGQHGAHAPVVEPVVEPIDPHLWGRIGDDGVVYVTTAAGERAIGNWQAGDDEAGLAHFGRKFDDFSTEIALLEARLASGTGDPKATKAQAVALRESVDTLPAIGDLDGAAARLEIVIGAADAAIAGASQARTAARAAAIKAKEALCVEAESLAESTQWKATGDRLKAIVEEWRTIRGIDRKTDDALWKRFAKARDTFTRHRGSHFAELDKQRSAAKEAKEALIARAEALSDATDWGETAAAYRGLMEEWKAAGRAPRDVEDALWARFRAAQEKFFSRRNKTFSDRDAEFAANAAVKEKLLAEGETIDPAKGLDAAKAKLRSIQERWEAAGKVPRERIRELDSRLRVIEDRVKSAEDRHWRRTDPETSARVEQFRARVESYRSQAAKARAAGDDRKALDAEAQARQWEEWLRTAQSAVDR